ncbi:HD-GYP domain-containing protein [Deinococcus radiomollis]|uniref:HD-GYP domain-containing protein n=1 Tax=Deinococcus radiomollis TaxID=468916 RepID=UPI0038927B7C
MPYSEDPTMQLSLQKASLQKLSEVVPCPAQEQDDLTEQDLLLAAQPTALFLLDDAGRIRRVAGAWEEVTGVHPEDAVGTPMASLLRLPNTRYPEGLLTQEGSCDEAMLRSQLGPRRVRVVWSRSGRYVAGHLERLDVSARSTYDADQALLQLTGELDEAVYCLGMSLDSWQSSHVERMVGLATRLAEALTFTPEQVKAVRWGAALHDVGKSRVPPEILWKNGPLTSDEFEVMLHHPVWGQDIVEKMSFLPADVPAAVLHHHERYDGNGYPSGLAGENIPLTARIVAIADVFDALTSVRSYKPAWSYQAATEHMIAGAGTQFDPWLVRVFVLDVLGFQHLKSRLDSLFPD